MITKKHLKDIAVINTGYTFRGAIKPSVGGNIFVLQAKNISQKEYIINTENLIKISQEIPRSNSFLEFNDVLLISRGTGVGSFKSTVFKTYIKNVIASSSVNIIRVKDKTVLPEYLALYLGSIDGQTLLSGIVSGSHIQTILRKDLEELEIPVPPIEKQNTIITLHENIRRQEKILERKIQINKNIMNASLRNLMAS